MDSSTSSRLVSSMKCLGLTSIPISRLEENNQSAQWYQMFSDVAPFEGLRCSAKIECIFVNEGPPPSSAVPPRRQSVVASQAFNAITPRRATIKEDQSSVSSTHFTGGAMLHSQHNLMELNEAITTAAAMDAIEHGGGGSFDSNSPRRHSVMTTTGTAFGGMAADGGELTQQELVKGNLFHRRWFNRLLRFGPEAQYQYQCSEFELKEQDRLRAIDDRRNYRLETGIIDYCLVLGPESPYSLYPTHYLSKSGQLVHIIYPATPSEASGSNSSSSPGVGSPGTGLFSGSSHVRHDEQDVVLYDRLPRQDLLNIEIPSKIEWFACPEGSKTVMNDTRPDPYFTSFVLSAGGETDEQYGLTLNFFVNVSVVDDFNSISSPKNQETPAPTATAEMKKEKLAAEQLAADDLRNLLWWHPHFTSEKSCDGSKESPRTAGMSSLIKPERLVKKWTTISLCVLFRKPFIQQLTHCLTCAYYESLLPKLMQWEDLRDEAITLQLQSIAKEQNNPHFFRTVNFEQYKCSVKPFPVFAEKLMAMLCLECPVPLPGLLSINLQLPRESPRDCIMCKQQEIRKKKLDHWMSDESLLSAAGGDSADKTAAEAAATANRHSIHFSLNKVESLPQCSYPIELLLKFFGPRVLIDVVCCILSECRMLFHSNDISKLPIICEALRVIIYPLKWTHVYLPVVPSHLLNLVEAPVPFMLGTHTKWLNHVHLDYLVDIVLVDCESGAIDMGSAQTMRFPDLEDRWLLQSLNAIATPQFLSEDPGEYFSNNLDEVKSRQAGECVWKNAESCPSNLDAVCNPGLQIQLLFFDVMFQLLRYVPDCLFYLNPSCPVFNRPLFINDYTTDECRPCMEFITVTNSFHELTETIHSSSLSFFYDCIHRQIASERKELQASLENSSSKTDVLTSSCSSGALVSSTPGGRGLSRGYSINTGGIRTPAQKLLSPHHRGLLRSRSGANALSGTEFAVASATTPVPSLQNPRELLRKGHSTTSVEELTLDTTPSPLGEGSGINNPDYLSPPDSLSSIVSASTPVPGGDSPAVRFSASSGSSGNPAASPVITTMKTPPPPRGIIQQKSLTGRGLIRNVSVMTMGAGGSLLQEANNPSNTPVPVTPAAAVAAAAAFVELDAKAPDSANEVVYRGVLPEWLLKPVKSGQPPTIDDLKQLNKVDTIRNLLIRRIKQYLPYLDPSLHSMGKKPSPKNMEVYKEHTLTIDTEYTEIADNYSYNSPVTRTPYSSRTPGTTRHRIVTRQPTFVMNNSNLDTSRSDASDDESEDSDKDEDEARPVNIRTNSGMSSLFPDVKKGESGESDDEENEEQEDSEEVKAVLNTESLDMSANSDATTEVRKTASRSVEAMLPALHFAAAGISTDEFSDDEGGSESVEIPSSSLLVRFDDPSIIHIQRQIFTWTVYDVADNLHLPRDNLWRWFQQSGTLEAKKGLLGGAAPKMNQRNIINQSSTKKLSIESGGDKAATCDDRVLQFIQKIVTQSEGNDNWFEQSIEECLEALNEASNRLGLISVLRHAKKSEDQHQNPNSNVIPLNNQAFKGFSKLFNGLLGICTSLQDYLCAYNLLEVGGLYFHIIDDGEGYRNTNNTSMDTLYDPDEEDIIEFLSERISSHPIYQSTNLWRAILLSRLPAVVPSSGSPDKVKQQQQQHQPRTRRGSVGSTFGTTLSITVGDEDKKNQHNINSVISEVHSLLYIMLGMGVNSSRAVHFIQAIAADYNLGINEYYKLQRFTTRMWSASGNDDVDDLNESTHGDSGQNDGAVSDAVAGSGPSLSKKKSKDVARDRRASVSINDMLSKQGHGHKLEPHSSRDLNNPDHQGSNSHLHRQGSTDSIGGSYDIRTMSMDDVIGNHPKVVAASGDRSDLGRSYHRKRKPTLTMTRNTSHDDLVLAQNTARNTTLAAFSIDEGTQSNNTSGTGLNVFVDSSYGIDIPVMDSPSIKSTGVAGGFSFTPKLAATNKTVSARNLISSASKYNSSVDVGNKYEPYNITTIEDGHATLLACADQYLAVGSDDGNLCISDLSDGSEVLRMKHSSASGAKYTGITGLTSLPSGIGNGYLFFSACSQGIVRAWTLPTKTIEHHQQQQLTKAATANASTSYWGGGVAAINLRLKQSLATIKTHSNPVNCLIAARHETHGWLLASGDSDGEITLSRGTEGSSAVVSVGSNLGLAGSFCSCVNNNKAGGRTSITSMSFLNKTLGGGSDATTKTLSMDPLDVTNKKKKSSAKNSAASPAAGGGAAGNEDYLAVGTSTGVVTVLDIRTGMPAYFSEDHKGAVTQVLGLRASSFISAGVDRCIKLWDIRIKSRVQSFGGNDQKTLEMRSLGGVNDNYYRCAASPITALAVGGWDNTLVVSASADGTVRLWDLRHDVSVPCSILKGHCNRVSSIYWNGRDDIHTASHDGTVRSWDSINARNINVLRVFDTDEGITSLDVASFTQRHAKTPTEAVEDIRDVHVVQRTCLITGSWNGTVRGFYSDSSL